MNGLTDRSFLYGDALFSTMKVQDSRLQLWPLHWQRLQQSAARLGFAPLVQQQIEDTIATRQLANNQVLKIQVSRGAGGRGYSPRGVDGPSIYLSDATLPDYTIQQQHGVSLDLASLRLGRQPALAGIKHCNRLENVLLKQELESSTVDELLVADSENVLVECTAANIMFYKQQQWFTPSLQYAGVAGVMRDLLMRHLNIREVTWSVADLIDVDAMLVCNALMGVVPVRQWRQVALDLAPVQVIQNNLPQWIDEFSSPCGKKR